MPLAPAAEFVMRGVSALAVVEDFQVLEESASTTSSARRLGSSGPAQPTWTGRLRGAAGVFPAASCAASIRSPARPGRHLEIRGLEPTGHRRCPTAKGRRCRPVFEHP